MAANRLEVFNVLGKRLLPAREIARRCGTHPRSTTLLLNACVALGFLRKAGDRYGNTPEGLGLLVRGKPTYIGDGINHQDWLWRTWTRLEDAVRTNRPVIAAPEPGQPGQGNPHFYGITIRWPLAIPRDDCVRPNDRHSASRNLGSIRRK